MKPTFRSFIILTAVTYLHLQAAFSLDIYVSEENGTADSSCWTGGLGEKCASLGLAVEGLQHYNHSTVWVENGTYTLPPSKNSAIEFTGDYRFMWMTNIAIVSLANPTSLEELPVNVQCETGSGLTFVYVTNFTLRGVELVKCGVHHYSTSRNSSSSPFETFYAALYFLYSLDVTLQFVSIQDTPGTGVVMYATSGTNRITNCTFVHSSPREGDSGGGGLYIEFPYCTPSLSGDSVNCSLSSNVPSKYVTNSEYSIESCKFYNNSALIQNEEDYTFILPHLDTHMAFGRGGGLSIFYKGNCTNNLIRVLNSDFISNVALWGAGLFIEHQDTSHSNTFVVESSVIRGNECIHKSLENKGTGGGGIRLGHIFFNKGHASNNAMTFKSVTFKENQAYFGGGLSFYTARETTEVSATNTLNFLDCLWVSNIARVGSGVDLSVWHPVPYGAITQPSFMNCTFLENTALYISKLGSFEGIGALYSDSVPVNFIDSMAFVSNHQTAIACVGARLSFLSDCVADFNSNTGRNGGAIALMGLAFIEVSHGTKLNFVKNRAEIRGGAIFGQSIGDHDLISSRNCFIRYYDLEVTPTEWESSFNFSDNTANSEVNSIYTTSLLPCLWGGAFGSTEEGSRDVFCWNKNATHPEQWIYSGECFNEIATSPATFVFNTNSSVGCDGDNGSECSVMVFPGISTYLPISTKDDRGNDVTNLTIMSARILSGSNLSDTYIDSSSLYISDNSIEVHGNPSKSAQIKLETIDPRVIWTQFRVEFSHCPLGMKFSDTWSNKTRRKASECICGGGYGSLVKCNSVSSNLSRGAWLGYLNETSKLYVAGLCPYTSSLTTDQSFQLPQHHINLCERVNRTGRLCGHCLSDYGPIVNRQAECHYCPPSKAKYNWVFYLLTEFFPIIIFFFIVVVFNISTTSGPANSFVFFAQVITTVFKVDGDGAIQLRSITRAANTLKALYVIPYDIWNQNFFHPLLPKFCISPHITSLQLLSTGYVTALFPLLLVMIFALFVWAYGKGFVPIVCLCRPVHKLFVRFRRIWNLQRSITHALATFILISYSKFTLVSFLLLTNTPLIDDTGTTLAYVLYYDGTITYLGSHHIPFVIVSVVVLSTFVALPPILLSAPSLILFIKKFFRKHFHQDLNFLAVFTPGPTLYQFLNAFHGCYKDGTGGCDNNNVDCRWFAGFYFFLRLILYLVYAFTPNWFFQFTVQQLVCLVALLAFVILQPYKNSLFNVVDACLFAILAAISSLSMYNYYLTKVGEKLSSWAFAIQYILIFVPLVYASIYMTCFLRKKYSKYFHKNKQLLNETVTDNEDEQFLDFADSERRYRDISGSYQKRASSRLRVSSSVLPSTNSSYSFLGEQEGRKEADEAPLDSVQSTVSNSYGAVGETGFCANGFNDKQKKFTTY